MATTPLPDSIQYNNTGRLHQGQPGNGMAPAPLPDSIPHAHVIGGPGVNFFGQPMSNSNIIESTSQCPYVGTQTLQSTQFQCDENRLTRPIPRNFSTPSSALRQPCNGREFSYQTKTSIASHFGSGRDLSAQFARVAPTSEIASAAHQRRATQYGTPLHTPDERIYNFQGTPNSQLPDRPQAFTPTSHGLQNNVIQFGIPVIERNTNCKEWAIRRSISGESPKCAGVIYKNGRYESCARYIKESADLSIPAPSFYGTSEIGYSKSFQIYWFCPTSSKACVASNHVVHLQGGRPPPLPNVWPVEMGTKLSMLEANSLADAGFVLVNRFTEDIARRALDREHSENIRSPNQSSADPSRRPIWRAGKRVNRRTLTDSGCSRRNEGLRMCAQVRIVDSNPEIASFSFQLATVSTTTNKPVQYIVTISEMPSCTCAFLVNSVSANKAGHFFKTCKHMYHVYHKVLGLPLDDDRPHQATLSRADVQDIIQAWMPAL